MPGQTQEVAVSVEARPGADDPYVALQETDEFQDLRKKFRGFVFPMTAFFLAWYFLYVLLSIFAPGFMNKPISGLVTVGPGLRTAAVRDDVRDHVHLCALGQPDLRPGR
jgi:hypothetical protein